MFLEFIHDLEQLLDHAMPMLEQCYRCTVNSENPEIQQRLRFPQPKRQHIPKSTHNPARGRLRLRQPNSALSGGFIYKM